jgi:hypothetical protein
MPYHDNRKSLRGAALSAVITGLVPVIPLGVAQLCLPKRDGRHKAGHDVRMWHSFAFLSEMAGT